MAFFLFVLSCILVAFWPTTAAADNADPKPKIRCYQCNSAYAADCGHPLNRTLAAKYLVDCDDERAKPDGAKDKHPVGCRIIDVELLNQGRIVRECAYTGENVNQLKKSGSRGVVSYITQCSESECNTAMATTVFSYVTTLLPIAAALLLRY